MMKIRGVLFDKDGTLIDFDKTWQPIAQKLALEIARGDTQEAARLMRLAGFDEASNRFAAGSIFAAGNNLDLTDAWHPGLPPGERAEKAREYDDYFSAFSAEASVPLTDLPYVLGLLRAKDMRLGIATNDVTVSAQEFAKSAGLGAIFDFITGYDGVPLPKPAGDMVVAFCASVNLQAAEVAVVGDNTHDLEMAVAGGAGHKVGVLTGNGSRADLEPLADIVLDHIDHLPAHLDELNSSAEA
ncbi:MAG: HAD family hydrolase [Rhizobiales bacterium]|nr:HAD family hydrolase [Hyphomicrobiales bacterium]